MMFSYYQWQFGFPETNNAGALFLFILIDAKIDAGGESVEVNGYFTVGIIRFRIAEVVDQFGELCRHLIRIGCFFILILFPLLNILTDKQSFTHRYSFIVWEMILFKREPL